MWLLLTVGIAVAGVLLFAIWRFLLREPEHPVRRSKILTVPVHRSKLTSSPTTAILEHRRRPTTPPERPQWTQDAPEILDDPLEPQGPHSSDYPEEARYEHHQYGEFTGNQDTQSHRLNEVGLIANPFQEPFEPSTGLSRRRSDFQDDEEPHRPRKSTKRPNIRTGKSPKHHEVLHVDSSSSPAPEHSELVTLRKREPVYIVHPVKQRTPSPPKPPKAPSPPPEPTVSFKSSFSNPMVMKISYLDEDVLVSVTWPKEDPNWTPKWEKRVETLLGDYPSSEYYFQDKLHIDRPEWGYRIMLWVPYSPGWIPDWRVKAFSRSQGIATPIAFPTPPPSEPPATPLFINKPEPAIPTPHPFGIPPRTHTEPASTSQPPSTTPTSTTKPAFGLPQRNIVAATPSTGSSLSTPTEGNEQLPAPAVVKPTGFAPKFSGFTVLGNPAVQSAPNTTTLPATTTNPANVAPKTTWPQVSGFRANTPASTDPATPSQETSPSTSSATTVGWGAPSKPILGTPSGFSNQALSSNPPTPAAAPKYSMPGPISAAPKTSAPVPDNSVTGAAKVPAATSSKATTPASTPSKTHTLPVQLSAPILPWLPQPLKALPEGQRADLVIPGPGTSPTAYKDYVTTMDEFKRLKDLMTPNHPRSEQIDDLVKDVSNKIGATLASFREKLGEDGLHGELLDLQDQGLMGVYYFGLERFAAKVFLEAALNKVLDSESNAIKYGERVVYMLQRHPALETFIKYWFYTKCPFAIPTHPQRRPNQTEDDYKVKELGFKEAELDNLEDYVKRTRRYMYFYASIMNTAPPETHNPMGIGTAWSYLVRTLSLPRTEISLWYLDPVVSICSRRLMYAYGAQWEKLALQISAFIQQPSTGPKFYQSAPFISSIRLSLENPMAHTPIQHYPLHENLMDLKSRNSYKMEFEDGRFISPEQLETVELMVAAYEDYLDANVGDIVDDILIELKHWEDILDKFDSGQLMLKESSQYTRSTNRGNRGGRGGRGGGGRGRW